MFKIAVTGSYVGEAGYRVDGEKTLLRTQTPAIRGMPLFEKNNIFIKTIPVIYISNIAHKEIPELPRILIAY